MREKEREKDSTLSSGLHTYDYDLNKNVVLYAQFRVSHKSRL